MGLQGHQPGGPMPADPEQEHRLKAGKKRVAWAVAALIVVVAVSLLPWTVRTYWQVRSSNPVRRGVDRAAELGCFACHGPNGNGGVPNPGAAAGQVPAWSGGVWMMYVYDDAQIREYILDGVSAERTTSPAARREREAMTIKMPAYRDALGGSDLDDLVAAFRVLAGMNLPPPDTPARRGFELAERWGCLSCHGPAGAGGRPNPGSFAGFIPGWHGADFADLVRDRTEFDGWVREGGIPRLRDSALARYFLQRQRIAMPAYVAMSDEDLDALWAYTQWLRETGGGYEGGVPPW